MDYLFDTNAIIIYLKDNKIKEWIDENLNPFGDLNTAIISVVILGELESLTLRNNWGERRKKSLDSFLSKFLITDINSQDIINKYGEIDAFSQGKLKDKPLSNSARNMGKNDLWIAATASVINAKLITSDKDFLHLDRYYLDLKLIEL